MPKLKRTFLLIFSSLLLFNCSATNEKILPTGIIENVVIEEEKLTFDVKVTDTDSVIVDGTLKVVLYKNEEVVSELLLSELINTELEFTNLLLNNEYVIIIEVEYDLDNGNGVQSVELAIKTFTTVVSLSKSYGIDEKITASDGTADDWFGGSVATEGNYLVVGAYHDDSNRGSIYVYNLTKEENEEGYERKITASDGAADDRFGGSVAIEGNYIVVGALSDDSDCGSIYVYDLTKEENEEGYERKITASDGTTDDLFGNSVAIEGNYVVVGACRDDNNRGSIYVYDLSKTENEAGYERKITASDRAEYDYLKEYDWFGSSLAISGNFIVVGAYGDNSNRGSIYVYDLTKKENEAEFERKITASDGLGYDLFGNSVDIEQNYVVVGAIYDDNYCGSIYVYDLTKKENEEGYERKIAASDGAADDWFGSSVAIEGNCIVVGANSDDNNRGSIYVYDLNKGESEEGYERKIIASDGVADDRFGSSVEISENYIVVAAYKDDKECGSIHVYVNGPFYKLDIEDQNGIETIEVVKDGIEVNLPFDVMIFDEGNYKIKVTDKAGNETIYNFEVIFE